MAANEIGSGHQVRGPNGFRSEAQVRLGLRPRLLRVVDEVRLGVQTLFGPQDLDGVLVRADRSVRTQPEEDRPDRIGGLDVERRVVVDAGPRDVVVDADREPPPRLLAGEFGEHAGNHRGSELLRGQPVAPAGHARHDRPLSVGVRLGQRRDDVQIQWLTDRTGLLGAVQHTDRAHRRRQRVKERSRGKRPVQPHLHHTDTLAAFDECGDGLLHRLGARTHQYQNTFRLRVSGVVDDVHRPAGAFAEPGHQVLDHIRNPRVERVDRFPGLEIDVRVLSGAADERPLRGQRPSAMCPDQLLGDQRPQVVVGQRLNRVDFVGGSESVEEVHERDPGGKRGRLRDQGQVVSLLHRGRPEQREPRLPHRHHVRMVSEDRQSLGCNRSSRHIDDSRGQFTGDLVHVRNHQQQALRRGEGRRQRAALQGAVQSARRSTLALHFNHRRDRSPHVGPLCA